MVSSTSVSTLTSCASAFLGDSMMGKSERKRKGAVRKNETDVAGKFICLFWC